VARKGKKNGRGAGVGGKFKDLGINEEGAINHPASNEN